MKVSRRLLRWLAIAAALVVLFTITGFLILPAVVKSQLEQRVSAALGRRVTVEKVRINPYALTLTLENFSIREQDGTAPFLAWRRLYVNAEALASLRREWVIGDVELEGFDIRARLNADQSFNFSDILAKIAPEGAEPGSKSAGKRPRPIRVARLQVSDARVDVADHSRRQPFATILGPLSFAVREFRTISELGAPYQFEAITEAGEKLAWSGTLQAEPFRSVGELAIENIVLPKYAPYYADQFRADVVAGTLSLRGRYEVSFAPGRTLKLVDGRVQLRGLKIHERGTSEPTIDLPEIDVNGIEADGVALKGSIDLVSLGGGEIGVRREKDGTINLLSMLEPGGTSASASAPVQAPQAISSSGASHAAPVKMPDVQVREFALKGLRVKFEDLAAPRPARLATENVEVSLKNVTLSGGTPMPLHAALAWAPQGIVRVEGEVGFNPVRAKVKAQATGVALLSLSPYIEQFVNARLTQGTVSTMLDVTAELPPGQPIAAMATGDVTVDQVGIVDGVHNEELAGFGQLALRGLRASTSPDVSLAIEELNIAAPYARVIVNPDKSLNLAALVAKPELGEGSSAPAVIAARSSLSEAGALPAAAAPPAPKIEIAKVVISDGDYRFADRSLQPNVTTAINHFGGTIAGLSSVNPTKADVDLKATVDGAGPIAVTGKFDPLGSPKTVDLKIDGKNVDLLPLSPYSGKYAGYELARGKLLLDVKVRVEGTKIDATNVITLSQFTFGSAVKSPDATSLPVRLGVALLKDLDGKIVVDVPVQGSTDDPNFRIGRVVLRVIVNLLTKAAVSPFSLLGAAFGGGGDELAFQEFAPGSAEIQPTELRKLETMTKALTNRPGLSLDLEGSFDAVADRYALKRKKLADEVRRAVWEAKRQSDPNIPQPEKLEISADEHVAMVKKLYDAKYPPGTQFGTPVPAPPAAIPPPSPPVGLLRRIGYAVTFRARRDQRLAQEANARLAAEHERAVAAAITTGLPVDDMLGRLAEAVPVDENDLRELAQARAQQVRDYFANIGKIPSERLFLAKMRSAGVSTESTAVEKGPRVFLHLQ